MHEDSLRTPPATNFWERFQSSGTARLPSAMSHRLFWRSRGRLQVAAASPVTAKKLPRHGLAMPPRELAKAPASGFRRCFDRGEDPRSFAARQDRACHSATLETAVRD